MDEMTQEGWKNHIRSIIIQNMRYSIDGLSHVDLNDHCFAFMIRSLENGLEFLRRERRDKENE
jgi:hypothetical protein